MYLDEIGRPSLLTSDEEVILAQRIRNGDQAALEKLTITNLRFVVSVAKQYQSQGMTLGDLISEGNLGLMKAAKRFDETRGFKFISYAVWWIRQSILAGIAENARSVRLPLNQIGFISRIGKTSAKLEQEFEREPTPEEIAEAMDTDVYNISDTLRSSSRLLSFDAPFVQGEENTLLDILHDNEALKTDHTLISSGLTEEIKRSLLTISEREREVLVLFYGLGGNHPYSLDDIGEKLNLTRERVRQIKEKAIGRLRLNGRNRVLRTYLG